MSVIGYGPLAAELGASMLWVSMKISSKEVEMFCHSHLKMLHVVTSIFVTGLHISVSHR